MLGEPQGVQNAYKCRVRKPWWRVPGKMVPDLFLTYMNHDTPRLCANEARVPHLNSVHGVTLHPDRRQDGMELLPVASLNSVTLLGAEIVGRAYGGGMLKLEPKEADRWPLPSLELARRAAPRLRTVEHSARQYVLGLLRNPETMRKHVEQALQEEIAALRNPERKTKAWASRLTEIDRMRVAYQRQQAEGLMSLEELRVHLSELDERRAEAERELATFAGQSAAYRRTAHVPRPYRGVPARAAIPRARNGQGHPYLYAHGGA